MTTTVTNLVVSNRGYYRKALADFIEKNTRLPKIVLPYVPAKSQLQSPMVCVVSAPTQRKRATPRMLDNSFGFNIRMIVLSALESDLNWSVDLAEDLLDNVEREVQIALLLADMQKTANKWTSVKQSGRSFFETLKDGGAQYTIESIPVLMEVGDGETE